MNFKNVAEQVCCQSHCGLVKCNLIVASIIQILQVDHQLVIAQGMRIELDELDNHTSQCKGQDMEEAAQLSTASSALALDYSAHIQLSSKQDAMSFWDLEDAHKSDAAFRNFCISLNNFLNILLPNSGIPLLGRKCIQLMANDMIVEHRFLQVNYESLVDWKQHTDYLQCNPSFHNAARYDYITVDHQTYPLALIQPYNTLVGHRRRKDKDLGFWRIRARSRCQTLKNLGTI
ncbi:hypothetical protein J3R83DRAFT_10592 [Lanmaoa asiatica]|nr:hypothetical protein J3R83DRAFT_10592 [Lanmaoa asiatica]